MGFRRWLLVALFLSLGAGAWADNLSAVADPAGGFVYLNDQGRMVLPGPFPQAEAFAGGLGRVADETGHTRYLTPDGKVALERPQLFSESSAFSDGLASFSKDGFVGFIDPSGTEVIPPRFVAPPDGLPRFEAGRAVVGQPAAYGWIKANGTFVESPTAPLPFVQGLSFVPGADGYRLIDLDNKTIGALRYTKAGPFSEGVAPVTLDGKAGWVDGAGKLVLAYDGDETGPFVGGSAVVHKQGFAALVDKRGNEVIPSGKYTQLAPLHAVSDGFRVWKFQEKEAGPWGLVDDQAKVLAPAQWDDVAAFSEGVAVVTVGTQAGLVGPRGTYAAPLVDQRLAGLHEGLAAFHRGDLFGYLDAKGKVVLEAKWAAAGDFGAGLAAVRGADGHWGLIDKKGKAVGFQGYDGLGDLSGKRRVYTRGGKMGFLDDKGNGILSAAYDFATDFHGGLAWTVKDGQGQVIGTEADEVGPAAYRPVAGGDSAAPYRVVRPVQYGLIDKKGVFVLPPAYDQVWPGSEGPTVVWRTAGIPWFNVVDDKGRKALSPKDWVPATGFRQGRAVVKLGSDPGVTEFGLVDPTGTVVSRGYTGFLGPVSEGAAAVQFPGGLWGFVDRDGKQLSDLEWDEVAPFSEGRAAVAFAGLWGYIDVSGTKIIPYQYLRAGAFHNGLAAITLGASDGVITQTGQRVWP
jgi:hypothetical protein